MAKRTRPTRPRRSSKSAKSKPRSIGKSLRRASRPKRTTARARRARALKGWETRRHNIRAAAARKGWETRRRNAANKKKPAPRTKQHPDFVEYQASVRYTGKHGAKTGHSGTLQGSVIAPRGTSASDLRQALIDYIQRKTPRFTVSAIEWRRRVR